MLHSALRASILSALFLAGCAASIPDPGPTWSVAAGGVRHASLADICRDAWELRLQSQPEFASMQKDERYYGMLTDDSPSAVSARTKARRELLERLDALARSEFSESEQLTADWLRDNLETEIAVDDLALRGWVVDPLRGPQSSLISMVDFQPADTPEERAKLVQRWRAMGPYIRQRTANLKVGLRDGRVSSISAVKSVIEQLEQILATSAMDSPLTSIALAGGEWVPLARGATVSAVAHKHLGSASRQHELRLVNLHLQEGATVATGTRVLLPAEDDVMNPRERGRFISDVMDAVQHEIYPAFAEMRDVLKDDILPAARGDDRPGLAYIPGGRQAYRTRIRQHTSLDLSAEEIHQYGLDEIARIRAEMSELGQGLFGTSDIAEIQSRLRNDPEMHFKTAEEVESKARNAVERARLALPQWFNLLPETECIVVPVPAHEAPYTTIAYYRGPAADGSRPGIYYINTYAPETRPIYEAEVLAYHEALPGHHLQIALAQELESLPLLRRHAGSTAFVEGWALYTERLCDEMGLYTSNLDRIGVLSYDAWRASRLVVDTGMHAFGWSRQRAIDYMVDNTLLAENNIANEVDRYIAWPGQALAYKLGQRRILELREQARRVLGERFDIRTFHDKILENGAVTLPILTQAIQRWLDEPDAPEAEMDAEMLEALESLGYSETVET